MLGDLYNNEINDRLLTLKMVLEVFANNHGFEYEYSYNTLDLLNNCKITLWVPNSTIRKEYVIDIIHSTSEWLSDVLDPVRKDFLKYVRKNILNEEVIKMKKLFISCPMKGRTEENIRSSMEKMHKMAEIIFGQELAVIPSYIEDNPPANSKEAVWYLGESIKKMAEADYFIGINDYCEIWNGCNIERDVARLYDIKMTLVSIHDLMPDCCEIENEYYSKRYPATTNQQAVDIL